MGLFSKKVYDPDMCFIRDMMSVAAVLAQETSLAVAKEWMKQITIDYNLVEKVYEYTHKSITAMDCYSTDQQIKFQRAQELLKIAKTLNLPGISHSHVITAAGNCIKKMGFSHQEKLNLVTSCIFEPCGVKSIDDDIINTYLNDL